MTKQSAGRFLVTIFRFPIKPISRHYLPTIPSITFRHSSTTSTDFKIFRDVPDLRAYRKDLLLNNKDVGFVPTMGALHAGHISLVRAAARENTSVFVSIYVNPTQFGVSEDLNSYPKTWDSDLAKLKALNNELEADGSMGRVTAVFAPTTGTMYPVLPPSSEINGHGSFVTITPLGSILEGASRPVFFRGVATVCMKLFNIVRPTRVYFGQKDVQQTAIIRRLVKDFHLDILVTIVPTEREPDGLAMSSRNVFLGERRRKEAPLLYKMLLAAVQAYEKGATKRADILEPGWWQLRKRGALQEEMPEADRIYAEVDYLSLAHPDTMEEIDDEIDVSKGAILSIAVKVFPLPGIGVGEKLDEDGAANIPVRLIDNVILPPRATEAKMQI